MKSESSEKVQGKAPAALPRVRRSNVERTATTQRELLATTVDCLFRFGFGATTTHLVAEMAGFSRGAMMHHFGSKTELMAAALRYAWEKELTEMEAELAKFERGLPRFRAMIDVHWVMVQRAENTAIHEIRIGSRSDPGLAKAVHPIMTDIARDYAHYVRAKIREAGITPTEEVRGLTVTWVLALPMMAFYRATDPNTRMEQSLLATLKGMQESVIQKQLGVAASSTS